MFTLTEKKFNFYNKRRKNWRLFFYNNQKVILINNRLEEIKDENGVWKFLYNENEQILEAVQTANNKVKEKFFDAKYKNGKLIESKYDDGNSVIKTIYKKYDSFGNWIEADIYYNHDGNCSFTIFRDIEYYEWWLINLYFISEETLKLS